jgi:hypothetical protein
MKRGLVWIIAFTFIIPILVIPNPSLGEGTKANVPRNVMMELFTATWCAGCPFADAAGDELKADFGERVSMLQYHIWDDGFNISKTDARADDYDTQNTSIPSMWVDGLEYKAGASSESEAYNSYKSLLEDRLEVESKLGIEITGADLSMDIITVRANLTEHDTIPQSSFELRLVIYENRLVYDIPKPNSVFNYVVRDIKQQTIDVSSLPATIIQTFSFDSSWNYSNMGAVVFAQVGTNGEVLQSHSMSFGIEDEDGDGLLDEWEMAKLKTLLYSGEDDPDGDGRTNLQEYLDRTDPLKNESEAGDSIEWWHVGAAAGILMAAMVVIYFALSRREKKATGSGEESGGEEPDEGESTGDEKSPYEGDSMDADTKSDEEDVFEIPLESDEDD